MCLIFKDVKNILKKTSKIQQTSIKNKIVWVGRTVSKNEIPLISKRSRKQCLKQGFNFAI
jgi:hypothetical protein